MAAAEVDRDLARAEVADLVTKFRSEREKGRLSGYNEAQVRTRFVTPLLRALGWDVEGVEEVDPEKRTLRGFADYALKLPEERTARIFVEAKTIGLGPDGLDGHTVRGGRKVTFPQQAIQYAWQMQAPWAVLTNFEETRLYSAFVNPLQPGEGLIVDLRWDQYLDRFDELWNLSKEATKDDTLGGRQKRRARETIQEEAPAHFFDCRELLVGDVHTRNPNLSPLEIQEAVQRTIDRLVVIRVAEDRLILPHEALWKLFTTWRETRIDDSALFVGALSDFFRQFDRIYNSEMFAAGHICEKVGVSNEVFEKILGILYEYNFDLIDADILGSIYEGYLSYVLREEKGELRLQKVDGIRKRTGVFYTPTYVVDYIVDRTVSPALTSRDFDTVHSLRVVDPACGSGSFLIKAFDRLSDWYSEANRAVQKTARGRRTLHDHEGRPSEAHGYRELILRENLFGVDLDPQAAEIASINLMLKALRKGQRLPLILQENVKVGNSLIRGTAEQLEPYFGKDWLDKHPIDWSVQFPFSEGPGTFDVVIGNPPYVDSKAIDDAERRYFHDATRGRELPFPLAFKKTDLYVLFLEQGLRMLRPGGRLAFIIPDRFLYSPYGEKIRAWILGNCAIEEIIDLSRVRVFLHQSVWNVILVLRKEPNAEKRQANRVRVGIVPTDYDLNQGIPPPKFEVQQREFALLPESQFRPQLCDPLALSTARKIEANGVPLGDIFYVNWGLRTGTEEKTERLIARDAQSSKSKRLIRGDSIVDRYLLKWGGEYITYDPPQLVNPLFPEILDPPKIVIRKISGNRGLFAAYDEEGFYPFSTVILSMPYHLLEGVSRARVPQEGIADSRGFDPHFVLAVLNSKPSRFYFDTMVTDGLSVVPEQVNRVPIPRATAEIQARLALSAKELARLSVELAKERELAAFRRVVATKPRVGEDNLGTYLAKLDEGELHVVNRLDSVTKARKIEVTAQWVGGKLELQVQYERRSMPVHERGTLRCAFDENTGRFLAYVVSDLESPIIGSGRLMTRLREVPVPRFAEEWDDHLRIAADLVRTVRSHEMRSEEIEAEIGRVDSAVDREVASLFGLDREEVEYIDICSSPDTSALERSADLP